MKKLLSVLTFVALSSTFVQAQSVKDVLAKAQSNINKSAKSQKRLEKLGEKSEDLYSKFKLENKNLEGALVYNAQLRKQIQAQDKYIKEIKESIRKASTMESLMAPMVEGMISRLKELVKNDLPFHYEDRMAQIKVLEANQLDVTISAAERFRQILETYRIEADYSRNIESYSADVEIDGKTLSVNMLRVGRIMLGYQSDDQKHHGVWDKNNKKWVKLSSNYRSSFSELYKITKKQASTNILQLPIHAPEGGK